MRFVVKIDIGNDSMNSAQDIARALREVAHRLSENDYPVDHEIDRGIRDACGNTTGSWHLIEDR